MNNSMWQEISYPIRANLANYPGDTPFSSSSQYFSDNQIMLSEFTSGLHYATHSDAPCHFIKNGKSIEKMPLEHYIGKCQVINVNFTDHEPRLITPQALSTIVVAPRVLFASNTFDYYQPYHDNYAVLSHELVEFLIERGCRLVGIDTPSIDDTNSVNFVNHRKLLAAEIAVIEGLNLRNIDSGIYEMLAIPLALEGLEASPLRVFIKKSKF